MTQLRSLLAYLLTSIMVCSIAAPTFGAVQRKRLQKSVATSIRFDKADPKVGPKQTVEVTATVTDQYGHAMEGERVSWPNAQQSEDSPLSLSRSPDDAKANTLIITGKAGDPAIRQRFSTVITAVSGDVSSDLVIVFESSPKPPPAKIAFDPAKVDLDADGEATIKANLTDADDKAVKGKGVSWKLANPDMSDFVRLGTVVNDDKTNSITVLGRTPKDKNKKAPDVVTLVASVDDRPLGIVTINYKAPPTNMVRTIWNILPPKIAGDNFGRTIRNDYYCIEVTIENRSGSDLALAGLYFTNPDKPDRGDLANTTYSTAHGSMAKRKLTHPRAMTLAIVDGLGTLMTGFNPFFHDINHAKNYSQFIDILSNPLKSGIEKGWKDPYPDELAQFEKDVLKDDKVIPTNSIFKTKIFVPKRLLFTNDQKTERENLDTVRDALGHLVVLGYKFDKGNVLTVSDTP